MNRTEEKHNTPDEVRDNIRDALAIVDELNVTDDLREVVFKAAVDQLAAKQIFFEQMVPGVDLSKLRTKP